MKTDRKILFQQRFERYYPVLCHIAAGYLPDSDDCEDVVQELFISMWNQGRDDMEEKAFLAYLKTATRNNCISRSEEHTSELQSRQYLVCRLLLEKKKTQLLKSNLLIHNIK